MQMPIAIGIVNSKGKEEHRLMKKLKLLDYACKNNISVREVYTLWSEGPLKSRDIHKLLDYLIEESVDVLLLSSLTDITKDLARFVQINRLFEMYGVSIQIVKAGGRLTEDEIETAKVIYARMDSEKRKATRYV